MIALETFPILDSAPPPDLITGRRGLVLFLTVGAGTRRGPRCRMGEGGWLRLNA